MTALIRRMFMPHTAPQPLIERTDLELARMGLNRAQLIHTATSGFHYA